MAQLIIDISPAQVTWPGSWWRIYWSGIPLGIWRDPSREIARMFLEAGRAQTGDVIAIRIDGEIIDRETMVDAARRKADPERIITRLLFAPSVKQK